MTYPQIDVRGRSCPEPVILAKKALGQHAAGITVLADSAAVRENIERFARNAGYRVRTEPNGPDFSITVTPGR